ncbi:hypothetical protein TRIUR3_26978 [Triticum urartu]|uniref:Uncharacterized protein n=2 Tax=Triticum TaxID=4564 RepID=M8AZX6_TRIUA|nr:hypothetical protein TRIUR3_26978 [Triticum urartu]
MTATASSFAGGMVNLEAEVPNGRHQERVTDSINMEACLSLEPSKKIIGSFGTFETAVLHVANAIQLQALRRPRQESVKPNGQLAFSRQAWLIIRGQGKME